MSAGFIPQDQGARHRIATSLDESLYVEAGAGTGKTSSLVTRLVALVASGRATLERVAVITFTEAAAVELRDRVREALERAAAAEERAAEERARCRQGVADLDRAAIQTLHGFAGALLREHPLEAGLPPGFEVLDEIAAELAFDEAWAAWLEGALDDPALQPWLRLALGLGLRLGHLETAARAFHQNYDLLEEAAFNDVALPQPRAAQALAAAAPEMERLCGYARKGDGDPLAAHARAQAAVARRLAGLDPASPEAWRVLAAAMPLRFSRGNRKDWDVDPDSGLNACQALKELLEDLHAQAAEELAGVRRAALMPLLRAVQGCVLEYARERRRQGRAEFHDLLVWARRLLRDHLEARDELRGRYTHILVDEAQDTDPLQAEIAAFLAEEVAPGTPPEARPRRWTEARPAPGKLFVVGDPKQSIYRFRRADVAVLGRLQALLGGPPVHLVQNFRSQRPVVAWVNHLFSRWMQEGQGQTGYVPIVHRWEPEAGHPRGPSVWSLGTALEEGRVGTVRRVEAAAIAALAQRVRAEGWQVLDKEATERDGTARWRAARYGDVCILMPRRTALRVLEAALEEAGVPYRLEGASLVFATQEVRDLLNCLRAVDDPADQVALVAALRSPALACSDVDLLAFVEGGGRLDYLDPGSGAGPVRDALAVLRRYHRRRQWLSPAALMEEFVRERRLMEAALAAPRPRERWRRYAFLVDRARAFTASVGGPLRAFLAWTERQVEEGARVTETPVPEGDEDAVRVMTVHGAKGLEFPIVVLTGLNGEGSSRQPSVVVDREGGRVEVSLGPAEGAFQTAGYEALVQREAAQEAAEEVRLMYVAATRARDHLVVSLYRTARDGTSAAARMAALLADAGGLWRPAPEDGWPAPAGADGGDGAAPVESAEAREAWVQARARLVGERGRPSAVAATAVAQVIKEEQEGADEPWRRGRGGTSLGRAVHAVLQTVDLATGEGVEAMARAQATAEGIPHREAEVVALARAALASDVVRRAVASGRWWREVPVGAPVGGGVLEGFVDLLFEEDGELVVVDYKTDALETPEEVAAARGRYRLQVGGYALALEAVTGRRVKEAVLLFLQPRREERLEDVAAMVGEARAAATALLDGGGTG